MHTTRALDCGLLKDLEERHGTMDSCRPFDCWHWSCTCLAALMVSILCLRDYMTEPVRRVPCQGQCTPSVCRGHLFEGLILPGYAPYIWLSLEPDNAVSKAGCRHADHSDPCSGKPGGTFCPAVQALLHPFCTLQCIVAVRVNMYHPQSNVARTLRSSLSQIHRQASI